MRSLNKLERLFIIWLLLVLTFIVLAAVIGTMLEMASAEMTVKIHNHKFIGDMKTAKLQVKEFKTAGILFQRFMLMKGRYWAFFVIEIDDFGNVRGARVFYLKKDQVEKGVG